MRKDANLTQTEVPQKIKVLFSLFSKESLVQKLHRLLWLKGSPELWHEILLFIAKNRKVWQSFLCMLQMNHLESHFNHWAFKLCWAPRNKGGVCLATREIPQKLGTSFKFGSSHNMKRASIFAIKIREKLNMNFANKFHFQKVSGHGKFFSLPTQVWSGKF